VPDGSDAGPQPGRKAVPPRSRNLRELQAMHQRIHAQCVRAAKAKPMTEAEIRALIDAFPAERIQRCPPAPAEEEDASAFGSGRTPRAAIR
jgi:hypothetical protein